ncbi:hypothetical protein Ancab_004571 [Ancistrocladus abbreviatus]
MKRCSNCSGTSHGYRGLRLPQYDNSSNYSNHGVSLECSCGKSSGGHSSSSNNRGSSSSGYGSGSLNGWPSGSGLGPFLPSNQG